MRGDARATGPQRDVPRTQRLMRQALDVTGIGGWECDLATERLHWTAGVYRIHDIDPGLRIDRRTILRLYTDVSRQQVEAVRAEAIRRRQGFSVEAEVRTALGATRWVRITSAVATDAGQAIRLFGAQQDVTAEHAAWDRLRRRAECDPLTGLANRGVFDARYREILGDPVDRAGIAALVLVDLDRFKAINDGLGHAAGDECLRQTARRLRRCFPDAALIARLGGDEFALLLRAPLRASRIAPMLRRAADRLHEPFFWNGRMVDVSASLGAAAVGAGALFERADAALYAAKAAGCGGLAVDGVPLPAPPLATIACA